MHLLSLLWFFLCGLGLAHAQDDVLVVEVHLDDTAGQSLTAPTVFIKGGQSAPLGLRDDGSLPGDVAEDHIWRGTSWAGAAREITVRVEEKGRLLGEMTASVPGSVGAVRLFIRATGDPPIVELDNVGDIRPDDETKPAPPDMRPNILFRLSIDDRQHRLLTQPVLVMDGRPPVSLSDDGSIPEDTAADGVWMAGFDLVKAEKISFAIEDNGEALERFDLALPNEESVHLALRTTGEEHALVVDLSAKNPPKGDGGSNSDSDLVVLAAPVGSGSGADSIAVNVTVDDRAIGRLRRPTLTVDQEGIESVDLRDDGAGIDAVAADGQYAGSLVVRRTEYLGLSVLDQGKPLGSLSIFMPSTGEAEVRVKTTEGTPGVLLANEPMPTGETARPVEQGGGGGSDRLAHVIWMFIVLFAVGFGYFRVVVWRTWTEEVRPVLQRMDEHLSKDQDPTEHE